MFLKTNKQACAVWSIILAKRSTSIVETFILSPAKQTRWISITEEVNEDGAVSVRPHGTELGT